MRKLLLVLTLLSSSALADPITGVQGFEYRTYRSSDTPGNLADLKVGTTSHLACEQVGFITDYDMVWDNVRNIADSVISNKQTILLGAAQYLLAKASPTLYSVLSKLNSLAELSLKYNFDACALYKKAQQEASRNSSDTGLSGLCMSVVGDPEICSAPGKALKAVFGKDQVDVVDEAVKNPEVADIVKAVVGTVILTADGDNMNTDYYAPAWHIADIYAAFYRDYYIKYAEIAERVHNRELNESQYQDEYAPWIIIGGTIDLEKVKKKDGWIDLTEAKHGGYPIPYDFFYEVSQFSPEAAAVYIDRLAQYAAVIDVQAFLSAVAKALSAGAGETGKGGILKEEHLVETVEKEYEQFARTFGTAGVQDIITLQQSAKARYADLMRRTISSPAPSEKAYLTEILKGPEKPKEMIPAK